MKTELILKFAFEASHSLSDYEIPHPHLWKLEVVVGGKPLQGMIIDLVKLRTEMEDLLSRVKMTYLNENSIVGDDVRKFPTCETLSQFFFKELNQILAEKFIAKNPSIQVMSVMVAICGMDNDELGAARLIAY
jgi:6-pyruvoyl-tetrahydropterin synthase